MSLGAFSAYGIELEYMLVARDTLDVAPIADQVLQGEMCIERGALGWSNELVTHVIELKNLQPWQRLDDLGSAFQREVRAMNASLEACGARLMPGGMHPWMDPKRETRLWPHGNSPVYRAYDRIFDCRNHGWANLQSMHINLPFADDAEFARLHAAVRLALPILPAIAAASPFADARRAEALDYRMAVYRGNSSAIPAMNGNLVPEPVASRAQYERDILAPLYRAIAPHDRDGVLRHDWLNARGAIARFDRNAIEIRVLDMQESACIDVAVAAAIVELVRWLYEGSRPAIATAELARIFDACVRDAERASIESPQYLRALGMPGNACEARDLWYWLAERLPGAYRALWEPTLAFILEHGPLARRLVEAAGAEPDKARLAWLYGELCECLENGQHFLH